MIKPILQIAALLLAAIFSPLPALAGSIADADARYDVGGMVNFLKAIAMYEASLEKDPENFEGNWKCARTCREYGEAAKGDSGECGTVRRPLFQEPGATAA